jgi:hydroxypyruvate reductase
VQTVLEKPRHFLQSLFEAAVDAADPRLGMKAHLPPKPRGRTVVIGAGKGAAQMARALEEIWDGPLSGVVVTRYGYGCETQWVRIMEASHPVPDTAGLAASDALLAAVRDLGPDDLVIALMTGGGSALLPAPPTPMTLADEVEVAQMLLSSGAPINAMNTIRKHLSTIKGGRLAASTRARVVSLVVSDIPGDNPAYVASGPTIPEASTARDALRLIEQYGLVLPSTAIAHLRSGRAESPRPDDMAFRGNSHHIVASARQSLEAAAAAARAAGIEAVILSDAIEGESRDIAGMHAAIAQEVFHRNRPFGKPVVLLSGGETTVTLRHGSGRGGRNTEFALAAAVVLEGLDIHVLAADTDGIDGSERNAGAFADGATLPRLAAARLDARVLLARNDSYSAFEALGDLFEPGPTGTNVNDFRAILVSTGERGPF